MKFLGCILAKEKKPEHLYFTSTGFGLTKAGIRYVLEKNKDIIESIREEGKKMREEQAKRRREEKKPFETDS